MSRKPKPKLSLREMEDVVIEKYMIGQRMSLEETAIAIWMHEGKKKPKPFSKIYALKLEQQALAKLRKGLEKFGIKKIDDVLDFGKSRQPLKYGAAADNID